MNKMIEVHDNIIPIYIQDHIEKILLNKYENDTIPYYYSGNVTNKENPRKEEGFSSTIFRFPQLFAYGATLLSPLYTFLDYKNFILRELIQSRTFLQLPECHESEVQSIHLDLQEPHFALIYYVTDSDGDTVFYDDSFNEFKRITPKKGRIAFFDGTIHHAGSTPTNNIRSLINTNFTLWN
jgi:hypothetical protein